MSLCHSFFPIGDNITMLTTADWLLGSNSQSAAGLSTLGDTMKGQYLVFSSTLFKERERETLCSLPFKPPALLEENEFVLFFKVLKRCNLTAAKILTLLQLLCLSFRKSLVFHCCVILF